VKIEKPEKWAFGKPEIITLIYEPLKSNLSNEAVFAKRKGKLPKAEREEAHFTGHVTGR